MSYKVTSLPLTNKAYGYPTRGAKRRTKPAILICVHITANLADATKQRNYANRSGSNGPSAHDYINRDGSVVSAIDPALYVAWSNGDTKAYDSKNAPAIVATVKSYKAKGYNANEAYYREIECVGDHPNDSLTYEQKLTIAQMIAADSIKTGLPISRATVGLHRDLNTQTRPNCPFQIEYVGGAKITRQKQLSEIIAMAIAMRNVHRTK